MMKSVVAVIACVGVVLTIAACGSDNDRAVPQTATVTVSESAAAGPPSAQADSAETDDAATGSNPGHAAPTPSSPFVNEGNTPVDTQTFYTDGAAGKAYYFQSPTGNVRCGIGFANPTLRPGCQAMTSVPSNTGMTCKNAGNSLYAMTLYPSNADSHCVNQPVYVGNSQNANADPAGGKVLQYGQSIEAAGVVCRSTSYGITCTPEKGNFGFVLARDRNNVF